MAGARCDVLIVGGGTGGCAAALAAGSMGLKVILTEETDWIGGQLTSQGVPADEHPWIEQCGCTARYRQFRNRARDFYRRHTPLVPSLRGEDVLNPGGGWVSRLCIEPSVAWQVLEEMLAEVRVEVWLNTIPCGGTILSLIPGEAPPAAADLSDGLVRSIDLFDLRTGQVSTVEAEYFLDATELGDLLPITGTEYVVGAESGRTTSEAHAPAEASPANQQGFTWVFAMGFDPDHEHTIEKPSSYERWKAFTPPGWPGPLLGLADLDPQTNKPRQPALPLFSDDWRSWFRYRQIVDPGSFEPKFAPHPVTVVNWPQNDYFLSPLVDTPPAEQALHLAESREQSLSLLYWLQTECPREDGGLGYSGLFMAGAPMGTRDGFAKTPYIRESRRIIALKTIKEGEVSAAENPGLSVAPPFADSVGIGAYRIDLHPSTAGDPYLDLSTLPFEIPLGALIPPRMRNLLPACKNIGTTHITNGCYRLHPVEWNIGESAGLLAASCLRHKTEPHGVAESSEAKAAFQSLLRSHGIAIHWPEFHAL
jgi:FAD dependent oxidoreductase